MKASEETVAKLERVFKKIAQKLPATDDPVLMSDIHLCVSQDSGELLAYDDNDNEITRCVVDQWIDSKENDFYDMVAVVLRDELMRMHEVVENLGILKPYSFILENDEREHCAELYLVDSDIKIIGGDLMQGLEADLDKFLDNLLKQ